MKLKLKKAHHDTVVGFNNSAKPLGHRDDLVDLAIMAQESNQRSLQELFEELPSLAELKKIKEGIVLPQLPPTDSTDEQSEPKTEIEAKGKGQQRGQTRR